MKKNSVLKFEIGNITVKVVMKGFWLQGDKSGSLMHNHAAFEFHTLMRGSALLETDAKTVRLEQFDSVLIPPEVFHRFKNQEKGSAILSFSFFIDKNRRKNCTDYDVLIAEKLRSAKDLIVFEQNMQIEEYLKKIIANVYSEKMFAEESAKAHLLLLFAELFGALADSESTTDSSENTAIENDARIFMIEEYFNEYYMENISLKSLSELLYLSEKQTDRMIKKAFGEGFRQHLCKIRLLSAQKLLTDTDKEVREIAEEVGYQSYNGFYLAFKNKMGITPNEYRENTVIKYKD